MGGLSCKNGVILGIIPPWTRHQYRANVGIIILWDITPCHKQVARFWNRNTANCVNSFPRSDTYDLIPDGGCKWWIFAKVTGWCNEGYVWVSIFDVNDCWVEGTISRFINGAVRVNNVIVNIIAIEEAGSSYWPRLPSTPRRSYG